ncbi:MAG TPA: DUF3488 and transglutaminase-like domain-containing protein [Actinomycetota bacterium]|nr:DUF3488 and transglutaminase-like domain-containing protein [Actinomycetota bacterium]
MAHPTATGARAQRLTALVAIVLVAVAVAFAFGRVFQGHAATYRFLFVAIASGVVAWAFERRNLLVATLISAGLLVVVLGIFVFGATTFLGAPTLTTLHRIVHAAAMVGEEARTKVSPASPQDTALVMAGITAVWAAIFSCYALAFRAGSPLLSLVPPVALVVFADSVLDSFKRPLYGLLFLVATLAVLFADSLRRIQGWGPVWSSPGSRNHLLPIAGRSARRIGAGVLALAAVAPLLIPGFGSRAVVDLSSFNSSQQISISPLASIGSILRMSRPFPVFTVAADEPSYWRMAGLDRLDPATATFWPSSSQSVPIRSGDTLPPPLGGAPGTSVTQTVSLQADLLGFHYVVGASTPRSVTMNTSWNEDSETMTVDDPLTDGTVYTVTSNYVSPTAKELENVGTPAPTGFEETTDYPLGYPKEIERLALKLTKGKTTMFDKVTAIQNAMRGPGWMYSTDIPGYAPGPQGVVEFLNQRRGFCQQYAVAMALMLRSINIPARVAIGFTPGKQDAENPDLWHVDTTDLHAWVEVPFANWGWLTFEPTPGTTFSDPATNGYISQPTGSTPPCPPSERNCNDTSGTTTPPPATPSASVSGKNPFGTEQKTHRGFGSSTLESLGPHRTPYLVILGWVLLAALFLASLVPLSIWARRRARLRKAGDEPRRLILATYDVFGERASDIGLGPEPGETPFEYRRRIEETGKLDDGHLARMTGTVVRAAYGPQALTEAEARDVTADADQVLRELRKGSSLRRRIVGIYRRD